MKRNFLLHLITVGILWFVIPMIANGQTDKNISIDLSLDSTQEENKTGIISATLIIRNTGLTEVQAQHPRNRMAVSFIVMNSLGNIVSPKGLAKVDPAFVKITIKPGSEAKESFPNLDFITGSALFGYELKSGENYRVVAIYRPDGEKSLGITTKEQIIIVK